MKPSDITYKDKLGELRLDISHPKSQGKIFIFVEGSSDIRLFRKLFDLNRCKVEQIPGGNNKVETCVETLLQSSALIIGIRDADFIRLNFDGNNSYDKDNMFLTDCHDIEMTMLSEQGISSALLNEYLGLTQSQANVFLQNVMEAMSNIGCLKWLNDKEGLKLTFKGTGFLNLFNFQMLELDFTTYMQRILARSADKSITDENIITEKVEALCASEPDLWQLTNGHDLLALLAMYCKDVNKVKGISEESIASALRIAYTPQHFQQTNLYQALIRWAQQNDTELFFTHQINITND